MRVLAIIESPSWIEQHIVGSLLEQGHEVEIFGYGAAVGEFYGRERAAERKARNEELVARAESLARVPGLDLIFAYVYDDFLTVDSARALAALRVPMINLNVDMANQWYRQIRTAHYFTRILCAQRANMTNLARYRARVAYFPMAARLSADAPAAHDFQPAAPVTFVGTPTAYRLQILSELARAEISLAAYGKHWTENRHVAPERTFEKTLHDIYYYGGARIRSEGFGSLVSVFADRFRGASRMNATPAFPRHGFVPQDSLNALFRNSKINLGFTRMTGDDPKKPGINQIKLRDFEIPAAGGFYLVEDAPDYAEHFKPGVEVETWASMDELKDKIRFYLANEAARETIRAAGERRARRDHGWRNRFAALFGELGLESRH